MAQLFKTQEILLTKQLLRASGDGAMLYVNGTPVVSGVSGALNQSGQYLISQIVSTGNAVVIHANGIGVNLSGNLTLTGVALGTQINSLSGFVINASGGLETRITATGTASISHANGIGVNLSGNLTQTGSTLLTNIAQTGSQAWNAANNNSINLSGNASATGTTLINYINGVGTNLSGNLTLTGQTLFNRDASISGALEVRITATGNAAIAQANSIGVTLSGNITQTGATLDSKVNSLSGLTLSLYGTNLVYTTGTQSIAGTKYFNGNTFVNNLFVTGQQIVVNTEDIWVGDNWLTLNATGGARDSAIFISTGLTGGNSIGAVLGLDVPSNTWRFGFASMQTDLATIATIASGEGVAFTGQQAINFAQGIGTNLSGNLTQTGATLDSRINSLSGLTVALYGTNIVYTTGNQTITGLKTWNSGIFWNSVGIGTASPQTNLHVIGSIRTDSNALVSGNLGIGTFSPNYKLHIASVAPVIRLQDTATTVQHAIDANGGSFSLTADAGNAAVSSRAILFKLFTSEVGRFNNGGYFGVGTSTPSESIHNTGVTRSDVGFKSGTIDITDLYYPRNSNPSGFITGLAGTGSLATISQLNSLSGWAAPALANYVYTTGAQTVNGTKTFADKTLVGNGTTGSFGVGSTSSFNYAGIEVRNGNFVKHSTFGYDGVWDNVIRYGANGDPYGANSGRFHSIDGTVTAGGAGSNQLRISIYTGSANAGQRTVLTARGDGALLYDGTIFSGSTSIADIFATQTALYSTGSTLNTRIFALSGYSDTGTFGQTAVDNTPIRPIIFVRGGNSTESSNNAYNNITPSHGIKFLGYWGGSTVTDRGGIYSYGASSWGGGLAFYVKSRDGVSTTPAQQRMIISPNGDVGMNLTSGTAPSENLHVSGFIRSDAGFKSGSINITDLFYPLSNPSGYGSLSVSGSSPVFSGNIVGTGGISIIRRGNNDIIFSGNNSSQSFLTGLATGSEAYWIKFPIAFNTIPIVNTQIASTNSIYTQVLQEISKTGFKVLFSDIITGVNEVTLNIEAFESGAANGYTVINYTGINGGQNLGAGTGVFVDLLNGDIRLRSVAGTGTNSTALINNTIYISGSTYQVNKTVTTNYTVLQNDLKIYCNNTNPITLTLPSVSTVSGMYFGIKLINTGSVILTGTFGNKFDGSDSFTIVGQYQARELHAADGTNWYLW